MRGEVSIRHIHRLLGWSRSSYYAAPRPAPVLDEAIAQKVRHLHARSKRSCGARTLAHGLRRAGIPTGRERAATIMRLMNITAKTKRFQHYRRNTKPAPAENLLARQFDPGRPNQSWASDITYIPTRQGWLYLAIVVDLFSRRIIGWATAQVADARLALAASELAFAIRQPGPGLIVHSDQGCQYTADLYVTHLQQHGAVQSMSRKGNCWDNAVVERVFRSLKQEWIDGTYPTREHARHAVIDYVARYYNHERLHSTLDYRPPAEFEALAA
ncbi:IS3 family transposase [Dyella sp. Tek66A03]|uniref:IS3 family transposase n=1 Tax=Dyella sp. Tek66A03 TaxID=3458298 RepID=UPI00403EEC24